MRSSLLLAAALLPLTPSIALAEAGVPAETLARQHIEAIASGDVAKITGQNGSASSLSWVGGPLNGTYIGPEQLADVWGKFSRAQAPLKATVHRVKQNANPAGTTVTADVVFAGKAAVKVHYVLLYRNGQLADEIWQIDPKLAY